MNRDIKLRILEICPSFELKKALFQNDYEMALDLLMYAMDMYDPFLDEMELFNCLNDGLAKDNKDSLANTIFCCSRLSFLEASIRVVQFHANLGDDSSDVVQESTLEYFSSLSFLNRFREYQSVDMDGVIRIMLAKKNRIYPTVKSLKKVFNLPFVSDDIIEAENIISEYIKGLILGREVTYFDVTNAILDDVDPLMEKIATLKFLREEYFLLKQKELQSIRDSVSQKEKEINHFGLERKK